MLSSTLLTSVYSECQDWGDVNPGSALTIYVNGNSYLTILGLSFISTVWVIILPISWVVLTTIYDYAVYREHSI